DDQRIITTVSRAESPDTLTEHFGGDHQRSSCTAAASARRCWRGAWSWRNCAAALTAATATSTSAATCRWTTSRRSATLTTTAGGCRLRRESRDIRRIRLRPGHIDLEEGPSAAG